MSSDDLRRRTVYYLLGGLGSLALLISYFVLLGGIIGWDGSLSSPLRVRGRGIDFTVQEAWHYLVPAAVAFLASLTVASVGGIWLVRNPAPRNAPF